MTPNPNENQAEKHSAEPFQVTLIENPAKTYFIQDGDGIDVCKFNPFNKDKANANRFVACVSFCAGVAHLDSFIPLAQMLINSRHRCAENVNLEAHLNVFREYVQKLTGNEGEDDALSVLKRHVDGLTAELSTLRKELEAAKTSNERIRLACEAFEKNSENAMLLEQERDSLRSQLEAAKGEIAAMVGGAADEPLRQEELELSRDELLRRYKNQKRWFQVWANCLDGLGLPGMDSYRMPNEVSAIVRELLNNGKDGR